MNITTSVIRQNNIPTKVKQGLRAMRLQAHKFDIRVYELYTQIELLQIEMTATENAARAFRNEVDTIENRYS